MSDTKSSEVKFTPPKGFTVPEATKDNKFDVVCTFEVEGNQLCLVKLGDTEMGYEKSEKKEEEAKPQATNSKDNKPDYSSYAQPMMASLGGM